MKVTITNTFLKATKKLHRNQITLVEDAIDEITNDPTLGETKIRLYKDTLASHPQN